MKFRRRTTRPYLLYSPPPLHINHRGILRCLANAALRPSSKGPSRGMAAAIYGVGVGLAAAAVMGVGGWRAKRRRQR